MTTRVPVSQLRQRLRELLALVERGERLVVTSRGEPIAEIGPPGRRSRPTLDERLDRMAAAGELIRARPAPRDLWDFAPARLRPQKVAKRRRGNGARPLTASAIILEQRG